MRTGILLQVAKETTDGAESEEEEEESGSEEESGEEEGSEDGDESEDGERHSHDSKQQPAAPTGKSGLPMDVLQKAEPGLEGGDFRKKLKVADSNIDTRAAFPEKKAKAEQVDFRNLLKKSGGPEKKPIKSGGRAQADFRSNLHSKMVSCFFCFCSV